MRGRLRRLLEAVEERTGVQAAWRHLADEPVRGGARWAYVFGSLLITLCLVQLLSGILLAFEYAPTTDAAHASVARLMDAEALPWGPLVRSLHHHGASLLVIALVLHVVQVAVFGAYRRPREANWITGMALGLVLLGFAFTGYLLPWDQTAFYATRVGLNIARSTPVVGPAIAELAQGGPVMGNLTLTRFYTVHVVLLPLALLALLAVHLVLFRRHGVTRLSRRAAPEDALALRVDPFWPHQAARDLIVGLVGVAVLVLVAAAFPPELGPRADPSAPFDARPEWYFYWLFQLLHWFQPPLEWLGTFGIPGLIFAFLALLPWLDRSPDARPAARRAPLAGLAVVLAGLAFLTGQVMVADRLAAGQEPPESGEAAVTAPAPERVSPARAGMLYGQKCTECHDLDGSPLDPDARDFRSPDFARMAAADFEALVRIVKEGDDMGIMPAFEDELTEAEIRAILEHVVLEFPKGPVGGE